MQFTSYTPESLATKTVLDALHRCDITVHKATPEMVDDVMGFHQLQIVSKEFDEQIEDFKRHKHSGLLNLGKPLAILQAAGIHVEMTLPSYVLNKKLRSHGLDMDDLKGLAIAIQDPVMVYKDMGPHPCYVIVTELERKGGKMSVALKVGEDGEVISLGNVRSVHQKTAIKEAERLDKFTEEQFSEMLKYVKKDKVLDWFGTAGLSRLIHPDNPELPDYAKVIIKHENPKIEKHYFQLQDFDRFNWLKTKGVLYGWTAGGHIYLTEAGMRPETPIHEYTHLWANAMMLKNPEGWEAVKNLFRNDEAWQQVSNNPNYAYIKNDEDKLVSEILAHYSGVENSSLMIAKAKEVLNENNEENRSAVNRLVEKIKEATRVLWQWVSTQVFSVKEFNSKRELYDCVLNDLMQGQPFPKLEGLDAGLQFHIGEVQNDFPIHIPPQLEEMALPAVTDDDFMMKLDSATASYIDLWTKDARKEQADYYQNIHKKLDYAQQKCGQLNGRIDDLKALNLGEETTPEIRKLENLRRPYLTITRSIPTQFMREEDYLAHIMLQVEEDFKKNLAQVAGQCRDMGLDAGNMHVICTVQKNKGMSLSVSDGQYKGFEALITITKGSSIQRIPHVRCHTSELKTHQTRETGAVTEVDETGQKPLYDKLMDTLVMADTDLKERIMSAHTIYYNRLWEKLPFARQRHDELEKEIALLNWAKSPKARSLKKVLNSFKPIVNSVAARYESIDAYLAYQKKTWPGQMVKKVESLVDKVAEKGLDTETTRIKSLDMSNGMVQMTLCDKRGQELDTKLVVSGIDSINRPPMVFAKLGEIRNARLDVGSNKAEKPKLVSLKDAEVTPQQPVVDYKGLVTKAKILEYNGKMFVTCHIGGIRMIPERIRPEEWQKYINSPGSDKTALAAAHYPKEIQQAVRNLDNGHDARRSQSRKI